MLEEKHNHESNYFANEKIWQDNNHLLQKRTRYNENATEKRKKEIKISSKLCCELFCYSIPERAKSYDIKSYFKKYGHITNVKMIRDYEKRFTGTCFIGFSERREMINAILFENKIFDTKIYCEIADEYLGLKEDMERSVFTSGLERYEDIEDFFLDCGEIKHINRVGENNLNNRVYFFSSVAKKQALQKDSSCFKGIQVTVRNWMTDPFYNRRYKYS